VRGRSLTKIFELGPQGEPIDEDLHIMELMEDPFFKNAGRPVPQDPYKPLGIGFGPLSGQQFPEACSLRFDPDQPRDPDGKFASGAAEAADKLADENGEIKVGDVFSKPADLKSEGESLELDAATKWEGAVRIADLIPTQPNVDASNVKWQIKNQDKWKPVQVSVGKDGKQYLLDGHNRVIAAALLGHEGVDAVVFEEHGSKRSLNPSQDVRFSPDQPRDPNGKFASGSASASAPNAEGKWDPKTTTTGAFEKYYGAQYPELKEGDKCDGRTVSEDVDNMSSIGASMTNYLILDGVREVDFNKFDMRPDITPRTKDLAEQIKASNEIMPFIVGVDNKGPYIMEGSHRYDAMKILGAKKIPAIVVLDLDELRQDKGERSEVRYSEDQPRDPDGKFASGGGETKVLDQPAPEDNKEYKGESKAPNGKEGHFSAEKGGLLFHGTGRTLPGGKFKAGETYTAVEYNETHAFAKGEIPGAGGGPHPWVVLAEAKPGKTLDVNAAFSDMIENGDPATDEPKIFSDARAAGARYVTFDHPSSVGEGTFKAIVSLYPDKDLKSTGGYSLRSELRFDPDQPRDPDGKFASGEYNPAEPTDDMSIWKDGSSGVKMTNQDGQRLEMASKYYHGSATQHDTLAPNGGVVFLTPNKEAAESHGKSLHEVSPRDLVGDHTDLKIYTMTSTKIDDIHSSPRVVSKLKREGYSGAIAHDGQTLAWFGPVRPGSYDKEKSLRFSIFLGPQGEFIELRYSPDQPRDPDGKFASGGGESAQEKPKEVQQIEALQLKMRELENKAADLETKGRPNGIQELNDIANEHAAVYKQIQELEKTPAVKEWSAKQEAQRSDEHKAEVEKAVAREAKEQNYERVQVLSKDESAYPEGFKVGGVDFNAGGYADLTSGMVTIISSGVSVDYVPSIMAHEIEHERFQAALNAYNSEHHALMSIPGPALFGEVGVPGGGILMASGAVRPEYQSRYPATTLLQKSLEQDKFKLYDSDGCTKYSEAYWKNYNDNGRKSADGERAMHETLAEMARVKVTTGKFPEASNVGWRDLYRAVDKLTKSGNAIWPNGLSPKHYQTGEGE